MAAKYRKEIDLNLCKGCGICIEICPKQVYDSNTLGKPVIVRDGNCIYCKQCMLHCPDFAIEFIPRNEEEGDVK